MNTVSLHALLNLLLCNKYLKFLVCIFVSILPNFGFLGHPYKKNSTKNFKAK